MCREDWDELDPYRLPARQPDNLVLPFVRPDVDIAITSPGSVLSVATVFITTESSEVIETEGGDLFIIETTL